VLQPLLADPARSVRRAALASAAKVRDPALLPIWCGTSRIPPTQGWGPWRWLRQVRRRCRRWSRPGARRADVRARIARILGRIASPRARQVLRDALDAQDQRVRQEVLDALGVSGYAAAEPEREALLAQVREEAGDSAWELACLRDLGAEADPLVAGALERELRENRRRIFLLLSFVFDPVAILRAREPLADVAKDKRAYALEILDVTLPRDTKDLVLPLCEELPVAERCRRLAGHFDFAPRPREERLRELVGRPDAWLTPWARACAVYSAGACASAASRARCGRRATGRRIGQGDRGVGARAARGDGRGGIAGGAAC